MASLIRISITIFILGILAAKGFANSSCSLGDIQAITTPSGREVEGKREWIVYVVSSCSCPVSNVTLSCEGFHSVIKVNPPVFVEQNGHFCSMKIPGLGPYGFVKFSYAWDFAARLSPLNFHPGTCKAVPAREGQ